MNELFDKVSGDIKTAMLARDKVALEALRGIKKELLEAKTAKGGDGTVSEEMGTKILQKMVKQRRAQSECLGIGSRRRTWLTAISCGEL